MSSDYEPSDSESVRKYYNNFSITYIFILYFYTLTSISDQLTSLLQDDSIKGLFEEFMKSKLNEPSNINRELKYQSISDQFQAPSQFQIKIFQINLELRRIGVVLEANPEFRKIRVVLEANPELRWIKVILEANSEFR